MNFHDLANILSDNSDKTLFVKFVPEVLDFTDKSFNPSIQIFFLNGTEITLNIPTDSDLQLCLQMLKLSLFNKSRKILCWNWKNFISYVLAKTKKIYVVEATIIDLKIIESYSGSRQSSPRNISEALNRFKYLITANIWKDIEVIYKNIHLPLMTMVIPHLETVEIIDSALGKKVFAHYEIEGQENGRLKCFGAYQDCYVPHAMKPELRDVLKPRSQDELFMVFDFKGMEVFMLAWMSKDPLLLELCRSKDIYCAIYEKVLAKECDGKNDRDIAKKFFLPVIYGQSAYSLSERCGLALDVSETIVEKIDKLFPTALSYIESYQKQLANNGFAKDIFGKRRVFDSGKEYSVRNFAIQSPSALVCLEKLNNLYFALKDKTDIVYTVHDGYAVYARKDNWQTIFKLGREVLSGESDLCPGLRLRVACRAGRNLNNLKPLACRGD